jgi:hypothetical protein
MIEHLIDKDILISKLVEKFGSSQTISDVIDMVNNMPLISYDIEVDFSRTILPTDKWVIFNNLGIEIYDRISCNIPTIKVYWKMKT